MKRTLLNLFKKMRMFSKLGEQETKQFTAKFQFLKKFLVTNVSLIIDQLDKFQKDFIWNQKHPKIKHSTVRNTYENGRLKSV